MDNSRREAIARIDIVRNGESAGHGTGCLVTADLVLTAMHVVANRTASPPTLIPGTIVLTFPTCRTEATVVEGRWDPRADWVLLRCAAPPPGIRPLPLADGAQDGSEWETFGFPEANSRDGLAQLGTIDHAAATFDGVSAYQLFSKQAAAGVGAPVKGLSGGPVIVDGALAGVFRSSLMREGQFNVAGTLYACPIDLILDRCADLLPVPDPCRGLPGLPRLPLPPSPYRFLERFTARDAEIFFGRNREIRELYDRVTSQGGAAIILLYGQSGSGKSSFLDAGLLPRLAMSHSTIYIRRDRAKGLLATAIEALQQAFPAAVPAGGPSADRLGAAWTAIESAAARPLIVILDQAEEAFTLPAAGSTELSSLMEALTVMLRTHRPRGRLVLAFRKEWLGEIQKPLDDHGIDYSKVFLQSLGHDAVAEVVSGLTRTKRLREKYGLTVEDTLPSTIAGDLTIDRDSPVAPTLQVLLSRLWIDAAAASSGSPRFAVDLYQRLMRDGFLLTDFLDHQLATLAESAKSAGGSVADVVTSGLALDVLRFHVSRHGTADERTAQALIDEYHRDDEVAWLVAELKRLYLLTEPAGDGANTGATRLAHDTLAPAIRTRCDESLLPGQRARRVLEARAGEWSDGREGTPLDARDLMRVEQGATGMRALRPDEERLVAASRLLRDRDAIRKGRVRNAAIAAAVVVLVATGVVWQFYQRRVHDQAWSDLITFTDSIPTVLDMDPALGLVVAIDGIDRSLELNDGEISAALQESLARALDEARERVVWTLPAAGGALAMSGDRRIAAGTVAGTIHVFRPDAPDDVVVIKTSAAEVHDLSFSEDGNYLAGALIKAGIGIWRRNGDRVTGLPVELLDTAIAVRFVPGGHALVALMQRDGQFVLAWFDIDSQQLDTALVGLSNMSAGTQPLAVAVDNANQIVVAAAFRTHYIGEGSMFMAAVKDGRWEREDGKPLIVRNDLADLSSPDAVALGRDAGGHIWVAAAQGERIAVVKWGSPAKWTIPVEPNARFEKLSFGPEARTLVAGDAGGIIRVYGPDGPLLAPQSFANPLHGLAVSPDGELIAVADAGPEPRVRVIDMVGLSVQVPSLPARVPALRYGSAVFLPSGALLALDDDGGIWDLSLPRGRPTLSSRSIATLSGVRAAAVDRSGNIFAISDGVRRFNADGSAGTVVASVGEERSLAISPDGKLLAVGHEDGRVGVIDIASGKRIAASEAVPPPPGWEGAKGMKAVHTVAFEPSGRRFATVSNDGQVRFYRADGTADGMVALPVGSLITAFTYHPDGQLITGNDRGEVKSLRTVDGVAEQWAMRVFSGGEITGFAIHPSGSPLYVAGVQGLRAIDLDTGSLLNTPLPFGTVYLTSIAASPDGRLVVAAKQSGGFLVWRADWREWLAEGCERLRHHELFTKMAAPDTKLNTIPGLRDIEPYHARNACERLVWNAPSTIPK